MVTLIEDGITVEADTIAKAKRALAKANKEAKRISAIAKANRDLARIKAQANAYLFMQRIAIGEPMPCGWKMYPIGESYGDCEKLSELDDEGRLQYKATTWSSDGPTTAVFPFYNSDQILGQICNSQGCIGLHVRWYGGSEQILGIGLHGDQFEYATAFGVTADLFNGRTACDVLAAFA